MKTPDWLNKNLFPFTSRWTEIDRHQLHYVDEGNGPILLFVHGTPEWSFAWRDLIRLLRTDYRCVALDMLGFGLSEKPADGTYTCQAHADRLEKFIDKLGLENFCLIANDFGGGISLPYAIRFPAKVKAIILFNTWMWSLKNDPHYSGPARTINTWLGKLLYLQFNAPVNLLMPAAFGDKKKLTPGIHAHYKKALPDARSRTGTYAFAKELMQASDWWQGNWEKLDAIRHKPFLFFWGMKDKFIPPRELEKWKSKLPEARVVPFEDAGHFVQEEKPDEMNQVIRAWL